MIHDETVTSIVGPEIESKKKKLLVFQKSYRYVISIAPDDMVKYEQFYTII